MAVKVEATAPQSAKADVIVVLLPKQKKGARVPFGKLDQKTGGLLGSALAAGAFSGKAGEVRSLLPADGKPAKRVVLAGLGNPDDVNEEAIRRAAAIASRASGPPSRVAIAMQSVPGHAKRAAEAAVVGFRLGTYRWNRFKSDAKKAKPWRLSLLTDARKAAAARAGAKSGEAAAAGAMLARDLGNAPGNYLTPTAFAKEARQMCRASGLTCRVLSEKQMGDLGMGSLLSVSRGSAEPAKLIIMEHGKKAKRPTVCLVGKGLTFDTGGISLKPPTEMDKMRYDMCGSAAVVGAMQAVAALNLPLHVVGIVASAENMPGSKATKPGDIVTAMNGKTIEVLNTDAEGRLVLADALCYAQRYKPSLVIDLATLTGAVVVALGKHMAGMLGTDQKAMDALSSAGVATHERVWQLPLDDDYDKAMRGRSADLQNIGGRNAGTITAAQFLKHFTDDLAWVHLDIAGVAYDDPSRPYAKGAGASGFGVRLLVRFLQERAAR
ncbi:MAG: leucyl aminopeptidase [Planctomycetes bacterium]|nr:leucyl aminopeptidase [Planctomycetota bacterium]